MEVGRTLLLLLDTKFCSGRAPREKRFKLASWNIRSIHSAHRCVECLCVCFAPSVVWYEVLRRDNGVCKELSEDVTQVICNYNVIFTCLR